jgi:hypothetical protein
MKRLFMTVAAIMLLCAAPCFAADISMTWDPVAEATGYHIQIGAIVGGQPVWGEVRDAGSSTSFTWTGASDTDFMLFRVSAYNLTGEAYRTDAGVWYCGSWHMPDNPGGIGIQ